MTLQLPIGYDNFEKIRRKNLHFVDKTLFIKELIDDESAEIVLITRPRRFGKTLNLSMLQCFFAAHVYGESTEGLFEGLAISRVPGNYMQHQGKYPVIFLSLKSIKDHNFEDAYENLRQLMSRLYHEYQYLLIDSILTDTEKKAFQTILEISADKAAIQSSLLNLCYYLNKYHGVKPWLLIDEYDSPIEAAYLKGYYEEMINFMRSMFGDALKTNRYLERAVITGILRVSKESLFSGLNNIEIFSMLRRQYGEYFGFTENEVSSLLEQAGLNAKAEEIKAWYNGYQIQDITLYNPWSLVNCIKQRGSLQPYWLNTSNNELIKKLLAQGDVGLKSQLELLVRGEPIESLLDENIVFGDLEKDDAAVWSLFFFTGYLKVIKYERLGTKIKATLLPPNYEVKELYSFIIEKWLIDIVGYNNYQSFIKTLLEGQIVEFTKGLKSYLLESASFFDTSGRHPERFYHGFVLGLMIVLKDSYEVKSNRESGFGRYDVMLIPKNNAKLGIIMEFKVAQETEALVASAQEALKQTVDRQYAVELTKRGIRRILHMGLAFRGKEVEVALPV